MIGWALLGGFLVWLSLPIVFFLAGGGIYLTLFSGKKKLKYLAVTFSIWLISFLLLFYSVINRSLSSEGQQRSWEVKGYFAPVPFLTPISETLRWYLETFQNIFVSPGGFASYELAGVLFLVGCLLMFKRQRRPQLLVLLLPILLALIASMLKKYTFTTRVEYVQGGRLLLCFVPAMTLLVSEGLEYFRLKAHKTVYLIILGLILLQPLETALSHVKHPRVGEDVRPVVRYLLENAEIESDEVYIYYRAKHQFEYYKDLLMDDRSFNISIGATSKKSYLQDIENLDGKQRVWFLFSYTLERNESDKDFFLDRLDRNGCRLDEVEVEGASVYLYNLDESECLDG